MILAFFRFGSSNSSSTTSGPDRRQKEEPPNERTKTLKRLSTNMTLATEVLAFSGQWTWGQNTKRNIEGEEQQAMFAICHFKPNLKMTAKRKGAYETATFAAPSSSHSFASHWAGCRHKCVSNVFHAASLFVITCNL